MQRVREEGIGTVEQFARDLVSAGRSGDAGLLARNVLDLIADLRDARAALAQEPMERIEAWKRDGFSRSYTVAHLHSRIFSVSIVGIAANGVVGTRGYTREAPTLAEAVDAALAAWEEEG